MRNGAPFSKPRVRLYGKTGDAQDYLGAAYNLLFKVRQFCEASGVPVFAMQHSLPDGAVVQAAILGNEEIVSCFPPTYTVEVGEGVKKQPEVFGMRGGFLLTPIDGTSENPEPTTVTSFPPVFWQTRRYDKRKSTWARVDESYSYEDVERESEYEEGKPRWVDSVELRTKRQAGTVNWYGHRLITVGDTEHNEEIVVSWDHGLPTRYRLHVDQDCSGRFLGLQGGEPVFANAGRVGLYIWGNYIDTRYISDDGEVFNLKVVGAGFFAGRFIVASHVNTAFRDDPNQTGVQNQIDRGRANSMTLSLFALEREGFKLIGAHGFEYALKAPWFFSQDGSELAAIRELSAASQHLMKVSLTVDKNTGRITTTVSETALGAKPPTIKSSYREDRDYLPTRYNEPSTWSWDNFGNVNYSVITDGVTENFSVDQTMSGSGTDWLSTSWALANSLNAVAGNRYNLTYRDSKNGEIAFNASLVPSGWGTGGIVVDVFDNVYGVNEFQTSRVTQQTYAYRDVYLQQPTASIDREPSYEFEGTRYVCVDYVDNVLSVCKLDFENEGACSHRYENEDSWEIASTRPNYDTHANVWSTRTFVKSTIKGGSKWSLKVDDVELVKLQGAVLGSYSRSYEIKVVSESTDFRHYPGEVQRKQTNTPESSSAKIISERGWLIELDLRNRSYIFERMSYIHKVDEPVDNIHRVARFLGTFDITGEFTVEVNGGVVESREFDIQRNGRRDLWGFAFYIELLPRWHDLTDAVEELYLPQFKSQRTGAGVITAERWHRLDPFFGDPKPRALRSGQLAFRGEDYIVNTSEETLRRTLMLAPAAIKPVIYHWDMKPFVTARVNEKDVDVLGVIESALRADEDTKLSTFSETFRVQNVKVV